MPPKARITTPGVHYWRVRADYGDDVAGPVVADAQLPQRLPAGLQPEHRPEASDYRSQVVVGGQLKNNGAGVGKARLYLERRTYPSDTFRAAGMIRTNPQGRFAFSLG